MGGNVENLILEHLRGMRGSQERVEHELREIKLRLDSILEQILKGTGHEYNDR